MRLRNELNLNRRPTIRLDRLSFRRGVFFDGVAQMVAPANPQPRSTALCGYAGTLNIAMFMMWIRIRTGKSAAVIGYADFSS
jgi:hypothetical protein